MAIYLTEKISLKGIANGYDDDCHILTQKLMKKHFNEISKMADNEQKQDFSSQIDIMTKLLEELFISGTCLDEAGNKTPMTKEDLPALAAIPDFSVRFMDSLAGSERLKELTQSAGS